MSSENRTLSEDVLDRMAEVSAEVKDVLASGVDAKTAITEMIKTPKFWASAAAAVIGAIGAAGLHENVFATLACIVVALAGVLYYCITEGLKYDQTNADLLDKVNELLGMISAEVIANDDNTNEPDETEPPYDPGSADEDPLDPGIEAPDPVPEPAPEEPAPAEPEVPGEGEAETPPAEEQAPAEPEPEAPPAQTEEAEKTE